MHRVGAWFGPRKLHASASTQSLDALAQTQNLEAAMRAATLIMNDDVEGAEKGLSQGNSSYHKLGMGVILFLRATLGFEQDIIREAGERLSEAEASSNNDMHIAQRSHHYNHESLYSPGSEFALINALAQIMHAVVAILNESLADAIRAFYKLRKAYITLNGLVDQEDRMLKARGLESVATSKQPSRESLNPAKASTEPTQHPPVSDNSIQPTSSRGHTPSNLRELEVTESAKKLFPTAVKNDDEDDDDFHDAEDHKSDQPTSHYTGHLETELSKTSTNFSGLSFSSTHPDHVPPATKLTAQDKRRLSHNPDSDIFHTATDIFVHSGVNLCFGILLLLISAIPPVFSRLLSVIGFRGDRERGIKMLWQAAKFKNINGGMAGLALLGWYNGLVGFCDIVPDANPDDPEDVEGYPAARLEALLASMRTRYPDSLLWRVEEARMAASHRDLDTALDVLTHTGKSSLRQVEALTVFERSMHALYSHSHALCASSFIECVDLNSWSRALYYYIAGTAHVAQYRHLKDAASAASTTEDTKAADETAKHARLAEEYFRLAPTHTGKKRIMARQLPFDVFVARKVAKWQARSEKWNCSLVDAVGVSPNEEMCFLWNGYKRMSAAQLQISLDNLAWSERQPRWVDGEEEVDERAILAVLRAGALRNLRRHDEAKRILKEEVLSLEKGVLKGYGRDEWTAPTAHYEMAVNLWMERTGYQREYGVDISGVEEGREKRKGLVRMASGLGLIPGQQSAAEEGQNVTLPDLDVVGDARLVAECREWIDKASRWESYELDARIGLKVTTASDALRKWEARYGEVKK